MKDKFKIIRNVFRKYFGNTAYAELPKNLTIGIVDEIEIPEGGGIWDVKYKLFKENDEYYLDFFASHHQTNSRHNRIYENGKLESLENYWEFGYSIYKDDPERTERERNEMIMKNRKVSEILKNKGFEY